MQPYRDGDPLVLVAQVLVAVRVMQDVVEVLGLRHAHVHLKRELKEPERAEIKLLGNCRNPVRDINSELYLYQLCDGWSKLQWLDGAKMSMSIITVDVSCIVLIIIIIKIVIIIIMIIITIIIINNINSNNNNNNIIIIFKKLNNNNGNNNDNETLFNGAISP